MGSPSCGKHYTSLHSQIVNCWRKVRCWNALPFRRFKFGNMKMEREVKVVGRSPSSGNESTSSSPSSKPLRDDRLCRSQLMRFCQSILQSLIPRKFKWEGKLIPNNDSRLGQCITTMEWREGNVLVIICWVLGHTHTRTNSSHLEIEIIFKFRRVLGHTHTRTNSSHLEIEIIFKFRR